MKIKVGSFVLDGDALIGQNFSVNQLSEVSARQGGFSNSFSLPRTSKNNEALGFPTNLNTSSKSFYKKITSTLIDGNGNIASGFLKIEKVTKQNINVTFFSDNVEWFQLIKDKKLTDLDLSKFDHQYNNTTIKTAIDADKTEGYTYTLIDYGEFLNKTDFTVSTDQLYPGMFVKTLFKQIFYDIGWKVEGSLLNEQLFNYMFVPFSGDAFVHSEKYISDNRYKNETIFPLPFNNVATKIIWQGGITDIVWPNDPGNQDFIFDFSNINQPGATEFFAITLKINSNIAAQQGLIAGPFNDKLAFTFSDVFVLTGDVITVEIVNSFGTVGTVDEGSSIVIQPSKRISQESTIQMGTIQPNMLQSDFLSYIGFAFNAIPQANNNSKTVNWGLFKDLNKNKIDFDDWTNKIDLSKKLEFDFSELLNKYSSNSIINYSEDNNDDELSAYENETGQRFGQGSILIDNDFISNQQEIFTTKFTPMININSFDNKAYIPQIYYIDNGEFKKPKPKICLISRNIPVSSLTINEYDQLVVQDTLDYPISSVTIDQLPFCWFAKLPFIDEVDVYTDSLAFDPILLPGFVDDTLKERYLLLFEEVLNNEKFNKFFVKLDSVDINNLDFLKPVYIDYFKSYFYKNKIKNYTGREKTTEVELVKLP